MPPGSQGIHIIHECNESKIKWWLLYANSVYLEERTLLSIYYVFQRKTMQCSTFGTP